MGSEYSQEDYDRSAAAYYETALQNPCFLPDVGIDAEMLKYSGINSTAVLVQTSNELLNSVPGFVEKMATGLAPLTSFPNAVGLGALVISMLFEIITKGTGRSDVDSYSMLRRVFGEEKGSAVRDTMSEYLKRNRMFINNEQRIREELRRLEQQLSDHLTVLKNSLQHDGQMSTRGFKIWVNGAAFHLQMMIHEARLDIQSGGRASDYVRDIDAAISLYLEELDQLLEKYKTYKRSTTDLTVTAASYCIYLSCSFSPQCNLGNTEAGCEITRSSIGDGPCSGPELLEAYMNHLFSHYQPILGLKSYFSEVKNNLATLIRQRGSFTVPSRRTNG